MGPEFRLLEITDSQGSIAEPEWLARTERVHRQLRPQLPDAYCARICEICASGSRMVIGSQAGEVVGLAIWRLVENTYEGRRLYVDDLVTDEPHRSTGVGRALMNWLEARARELGCHVLALDSGVHRGRAHAFYFREGMTIPSFCFRKTL